MKSGTAFIHRWLGLALGLVVFIVGITGCIYEFHAQINSWRFANIYTIQKNSSSTPLPLSTLKKKAKKTFGEDIPLLDITTYRNPDKAWKFRIYRPAETSGYTYFSSVDQYKSLYLNPYNGKINGFINNKYEFFNIVEKTHRYLLLSKKYGAPIVGGCAILFLVLFTSGIILWWRRRMKGRRKKPAFKIKWKSTWRRVNYDLHNILGFYIYVFVLISIITGLALAFPWFKSAVYGKPHSTPKKTQEKHYTPTLTNNKAKNSLDRALEYARRQRPHAARYIIHPASKKEQQISIGTYPNLRTEYNPDRFFFNKQDGHFLRIKTYQSKSNREKLSTMNKDIHKGTVGGVFTQVVVFIIGLVVASLPVTGVIFWWDKSKRRRKKR